MKNTVFWNVTLYRVRWKSADVSEEHDAPIFKVEEQASKLASCWLLAWLVLGPWRWGDIFLGISFGFSWLRDVIPQKVERFLLILFKTGSCYCMKHGCLITRRIAKNYEEKLSTFAPSKFETGWTQKRSEFPGGVAFWVIEVRWRGGTGRYGSLLQTATRGNYWNGWWQEEPLN
jgi:hypothetical protein